jgi:D-beta-D-heptose 7-phosphate kinase/D-beta-D-heptose 1-phosphate adenosyltransferase
VLVSDYDKGVITSAVRDTLVDLKARNPKYIAVDSKRLTFFRPLRPSLIKPNYDESIRLLDLPAITSYRMNQILPWPEVLHEKTAAEVIAVTLDSEGALVMEKDRCVYQAPALPVKTPRVAGAGDAFIGAFLLAQLGNADLVSSTDLALAAAALAIQKHGTASCTRQELQVHFAQCEKCIGSMDTLEHLCALYKQQGKRVVFTNGCFDILHSGHVSYLNQARTLGDVLIVGMNNDASIRRIKGAQRPINPLQDRIHVLAGLAAVDHIVAFGSEEDDTPVPVIDVVKPDIFVKGGDYANKDLPEGPTVERHGGRIVILPLMPDRSTSRIINKVQETHALSTVS